MDDQEIVAQAEALEREVEARINVLEAEDVLLLQQQAELRDRRQQLRQRISELESIFSHGCTDH